MYSWRFVTLAAVSKDEQIDRASIPSQLEITHATGERLGGTFVNQYVIDGYSRTAYYNLDDALADIPPLKECLGAIGQFDVLIVKNYDRLGSLGMLLYYYFNQYRKQLYSVQQATQIQDPETYNPASDISVPSMIISASQNQVYRIAKISDAFVTGTKKRVADGYFARRIPYGYIRKDKYNVELVPHVAELLRHFPVWFLEGKSIHKIMQLANESGVSRAGNKISFIFVSLLHARIANKMRCSFSALAERFLTNYTSTIFAPKFFCPFSPRPYGNNIVSFFC